MQIDQLSVNTIRCLAADVVNGANSGHPGAPIGCAPIAYSLFHNIMHYDPADPKWINRDRFVLSNGHASALLYTMLHLTGYEVSMDDLKNFRQLHSITPGHPERGETPGVEVTTGPLGQGISNAVGLAIAERHLGALYNRENFPIFNSKIYTLLGDGCLQEGVASEACSLAGHLGLSNLVAIWDDNRITIDGSTSVSFTEDVCARFKAYNWSILEVEEGNTDIEGITNAIKSAGKEGKPTLIRVHTTIGYGSPSQNTAKVHGSPLGAGVVELKRFFGMPEDLTYNVPEEVRAHFAKTREANVAIHKEWDALFAKYAEEYPSEHAELVARFSEKTSADIPAIIKQLSDLCPIPEKALATRQTSQIVLNALARITPALVGGSADLKGSNLTGIDGWKDFSKDCPEGHYLHFGIREFAMCAIANGISAFGGLLPFDATFLVFFNYCCGAIRVGALSKLHCLHVFTHDSIGVGQDGPTHQPIETLAWIRSLPDAIDWRPADLRETIGAYAAGACENTQHIFALSRQGLPQLSNSDPLLTAQRGAYVIYKNCECTKNAVRILASGSEVKLAIEAADKLKGKIDIVVVSVPSYSVFDKQSVEYKKEIVPALEQQGAPVIAVEPYCTFGWDKYAHRIIGIDRYGLSAPDVKVYEELGITTNAICTAVEEMYAKNKVSPAPQLSW